MRKDEVVTGGLYKAKVSGKVVVVQIIGERMFKGWDAKNLETGRTVYIKTAARLRERVEAP